MRRERLWGSRTVSPAREGVVWGYEALRMRNANVNSGPALAGGGIVRKSVAFEVAIGDDTGHTQGTKHHE